MARVTRNLLGTCLGMVLIAGLVVGGVAALLWHGPVTFVSLTGRVAEALEAQFGHGYDVDVQAASISWDHGPNLAMTGVTIRDGKGDLVVSAPRAVVSFDPWTLGTGQMAPRNISFVGLSVALTITPEGSVSISAAGPLPPRQERPLTRPADAGFGPGAVLDALLATDGPVAVLEKAGVRDGKLRIDDQRRGIVIDYTDFSLGYARPQDGSGRLSVSARGPSGHWTVEAAVRGTAGAERSVRLDMRDLALSDLIGLANPGTVPLATEMPISGHVALSVGPDGAVTDLDGRLHGGKAMVLFEDPDAEPVFVDSLEADFGWDAAQHAVALRSFDLRAGETRLALSGTITPPRAADEVWALRFSSDHTAIAAEKPGEPPVVLDKVAFEGHMPLGLGALFVERLDASGPSLSLHVDGAMGSAPGIDGLRYRLSAGPVPIRQALALWPSFIAPEVKSYFVDSVSSGTLTSIEIRDDLDAAALRDAFQKKPLPDAAVSVKVVVSDGVIRPAPGLPELSGVEATGLVTGRTARFAIRRATTSPSPGKTLVLGGGRFDVEETARKPAIATISFDVAGSADAMLETLRSEALRPYVAVPADLTGVKGQVEATARIVLPLQPVLGPNDVVATLQGSGVSLAAEGLPGKEKMEDAALSFEQTREGLSIRGEARLGGVPAQIQMSQPAGGPSEVVLSMVLDEAARARRGIRLPGQVTGPVDAKVTIRDPGSAKAQTRVELDLAKASLADVLPGWSKPAGKLAKASFRMASDGDTTLIDDFVFDGAGGVSLKGSLRLAGEQGLAAAKFSLVRLSPGDDLHVDLDRTGGVLKATVRGPAFDARPLLRALTAPGGSTLSGPGDSDLDLKVGTIQGLNGEALTTADLKLVLRGGEVRDFRLGGRLAQSPVSGQVAQLERGTRGLVLESGDAGGFLRFVDIYRRMLGGSLLLTLSGPGSTMDGTMVINNFVLSNEPALAKTAPGGERTGSGGGEAANNVLFTKLRAGFSVGGGRLAIRDATMWGQSVGGTLDGSMDFGRDQVNLTGTFVPAYGLNNIINQVPVVGPILGGGQHEGLFAVNFRISGKVSQPTLSINPLSAVAPGFLRKFFGVFNPDDGGEPPGGPGNPARSSQR